jgi:hypothetical protein
MLIGGNVGKLLGQDLQEQAKTMSGILSAEGRR